MGKETCRRCKRPCFNGTGVHPCCERENAKSVDTCTSCKASAAANGKSNYYEDKYAKQRNERGKDATPGEQPAVTA
jgi:hypothetical protein